MSFLTPLFLLLGLLAGPIIILYMLRLRRREVLVSSTLLWQKLLRDREANAPWQKLRRNLLLILQLLILAVLVLALARPFIPIPSVVNGSVVVLLDASASMQASDSEPSRFAAAQAEVEQIINDLSGNNQMTLIQVGQTPAVLAAATNDPSILRQALADAQPQAVQADWASAFALATGAAQGFNDARILIISDGGLPDDLPPLPVESIYIPIGSSGENLAITALATRDTETGPQLFASVSNEGILDQEGLLTVTLDGILFDSRRLTIPAGSTANTTWELSADTRTIQAALSDFQEDHLAADNRAWAVHEGGISNRALLVTEGNLFLEQIYAVLPGVEAFKAAPDSDVVREPFDLYIFDGTPLPDPAPDADMLIINPQPSGTADLFTVNNVFSDTVAIRLADSPLLQFVDWRNVHVRHAQQVEAPGMTALVQGEGGPLLLTGEHNGRRLAILTFDIRDSDLPLQIAFPVLMANVTSWLNPGRAFDAPTGLQPGDPVTIAPGASSTAVLVTKPNGTTWVQDVGEGDIFFTETEQVGLYQVALRDDSGSRAAGSFAVNLFSPAESAIQPSESLQIGQTTVTVAEEEGDVGQRELWPWLAGLAFLILMLEWWVHHRGTPTFKIRFPT